MVKIKCNDKLFSIKKDPFNVIRTGKNYSIVNESGLALELSFKIDDSTVKFTPEQYDKMTVELSNNSRSYFELLQAKIKEKKPIENFIKNGCINLKLTDDDQKQLILDSLQRKDKVNIIVKFNGLWKVKDKYYASIILINFNKVRDALGSNEVPSFVDE